VSLTSHKQSGRGGERSLHTGGVLSEVRSLLRPPRFHSWALLRDLKTTGVLDELQKAAFRRRRRCGGRSRGAQPLYDRRFHCCA